MIFTTFCWLIDIFFIFLIFFSQSQPASYVPAIFFFFGNCFLCGEHSGSIFVLCLCNRHPLIPSTIYFLCIHLLCVSISALFIMLPDRQSVVVRFDCSTGNVHRNIILDLCCRNKIRVEKILIKSFGYLLICPSVTDAEKLFENKVQDVLKERKIKSYIPRELRTKHYHYKKTGQ